MCEIYAIALDQHMVYTCAYYEQPGLTLAEAQIVKLDHACRKLQLQPGQKESGHPSKSQDLVQARNECWCRTDSILVHFVGTIDGCAESVVPRHETGHPVAN